MSLPLITALIELEQHVARAGWGQPPRLFALVETADLLRREPGLAAALGLPAPPTAGAGPHADAGQLSCALGRLTSIEQEQGELPLHNSLEQLLAGIAWPAEVLGAALVVERVMLPTDVEAQLPLDEADALGWLAEHPARQDVRLAVAVLRDGSRQSALRFRSHDRDDAVLSGPDLVPGLVHALALTLVD
jgi:hypothetical protein